MSYGELFLLLMLFLMMLSDLYTDRIPNGTIVIGIITGLVFRYDRQGAAGVMYSMLSMAIAFFLTYFLFKIGAFGAGDVKLFLVVGSFFGTRDSLLIMACSFGIGAVFAVVRLITQHNAAERMRYLFAYLSDVARSGQWKLYGEDLKGDYMRYCSNKIHFTVPVLIGTVLRIGGLV